MSLIREITADEVREQRNKYSIGLGTAKVKLKRERALEALSMAEFASYEDRSDLFIELLKKLINGEYQ